MFRVVFSWSQPGSTSITYIIEDLALNNLQGLICHTTQPNMIIAQTEAIKPFWDLSFSISVIKFDILTTYYLVVCKKVAITWIGWRRMNCCHTVVSDSNHSLSSLPCSFFSFFPFSYAFPLLVKDYQISCFLNTKFYLNNLANIS